MLDKKILLIASESKNRERIASFLRNEGATLLLADQGDAGLKQLYEQRPDLILLDVGPSQGDEWRTCRRLRRLTLRPIILLGDLYNEERVEKALREGGDYYLSWTSGVRVLRLAIRSALRLSEREPRGGEETIRCSEGLTVDLLQGMVFVDGERLKLTDTEYRLLAYFARHPNRVLTYDEIQENVWGWQRQARSNRNIHLYVSRLRRKIEADPGRPEMLLTEYGSGYRLHCPLIEGRGE